MAKIPKDDDVPAWFRENVSADLSDSTLFRFQVKLNAQNEDGTAKKVLVDILPDLVLDLENLIEQMEVLPAQYAFWAAVYSEAKMACALAERELKTRRGKITQFITEQAQESRVKLSVDTIKTIVEANEDLVRADALLQKAHMKAGKLYNMMEALKMKAELARSLAAFKRQEMSNS